nr:hypothetical protein BaRGS_028713 [Batillaria attramentaria]
MLVLVMIALCVFIFIPTRNLLLSPVLPGHWYDHSTVRLLKTYFGERHNFPLKNLASHKNSSDLKPQLLQVNVSDVAKFREAAYPEFYARREQLAARAKGDNEAARKLSLVDPFKPVLTVEERAQLLFTVDVFVRACRKHGLMFFLGEGTVLGAYRHHGLVPWDDDVDIYVNASQWREVHHVLSNIPGFSLQSTSTGLWKFYLSSLPRFFNKKFKWPNIDLFWFTEDNTHVWGFTKNFYEFLLIDRSHLLPLASVPWERWRMPVPACWHHYTEQRFDVSECDKDVRKWIVKEALHSADDYCLRKILTRYVVADPDLVLLESAVERGTLLQRGIGEDQIRRVVEVATDLAEDCELSIILQFCPQSQLESVLTADHTLYDDQRSLMIKTALEQEQWDVVMVLADHGMTDDQLRRVHRQVAKHADWNTVLQLFERGANLHRVTKELETANPSRHRPPDERKLDEDEYRKRLAEYTEIETKYKQRLKELETLASQLERDAMDYREAIQASNWAAVLYHIYRGASEDQVKMTLEAAVEKEAQHVLVTLVRLGMDAAQRDWLFREAMTRRLWSVGRALLERPVSRELPRDAASWDTLQRLMEEGQWILVARVMEYDVSDDLRLNVMHHALNRREGSVVAYIISIMEGRVTVKERETVFRQALSKGLWETVRRLVEEKDSTGIAHRDEAMFAAVKQERWDVVEHCVRHGADIDKRDATGLTMLQREINPRHTKELLHQGVGKPRVREKKVMQLPVLSKPMKQYVLFRDITHPDFGETQHD